MSGKGAFGATRVAAILVSLAMPLGAGAGCKRFRGDVKANSKSASILACPMRHAEPSGPDSVDCARERCGERRVLGAAGGVGGGAGGVTPRVEFVR